MTRARALPPGLPAPYIARMQTFLFVCVILCAIGALAALVRGIVIFLQTTEQDLKGTGPVASGLRQNKMMWRRIQFQGLAIVFVMLFLLLSRAH